MLQRRFRGIQQTELLAFTSESSLNLVNAGSDLYYSLQIGFFHALGLPSNSTNPHALRQLLVACVFSYRSEAPETSVKSAEILLLTSKVSAQTQEVPVGFGGAGPAPAEPSGAAHRSWMGCGSGSSSYVQNYSHPPAASSVPKSGGLYLVCARIRLSTDTEY